MLQVLFWAAAGLLVYIYFGYPLLLVAIRALRGSRPVAVAPVEPTVTLIISAYNEEASIGEKLANSAAIDYPQDKVEILVVSDASTDRTDAIVSGFASAGVRLLRMSERGGKTAGINRATREARGDILVFSDANALYRPEAIRMLVRNFADPAVGAAIGESTYIDTQRESASESEGLYWRYETSIKKLESAIGSVVGGDGAIYAIRRQLYRELAADALSDFVNPLQIRAQGHRVVYEPAARSYERAGDQFGKEFQRKVRIVNRAWRATLRMSAMLNPLRYGLFAVELISHKLLRWLAPAFMILLYGSNLLLLGSGWLYGLAFIAQSLFYLLALFGWLLQERGQLPKPVAVAFFFCLVNVASAKGIIDAFRGKTYTTWSTVRSGA